MSAPKKTKIDLNEKRPKKDIFGNKEILVMRIAVAILAFIIIALWAFNQKNVWRNNSDSNVDLSSDIINIIKEPKPEFEEGKEILTDQDLGKRLEQDAGKLLEDVMKEADKRATNTELSSCPEWINCMPTIGEVKPCVIPSGCEDITKIAY